MAIINLTPHAITVIPATGTVAVYPPTGVIARVTSTGSLVYHCDGIPCYRTTYGAVEGLPEPVEGTFYLVSALVRQAVPGRTDVLSPGELVRNEAGQLIGYRAFVAN